ncbi:MULTISPECIES: ATP-binding protein [unclassified Coleofasciculus]|uniref:ATP-binding protein n=1 Tax=unclassified Coleofasciculus TaxID=2692782 RepID=UPI001D13B3D8|nr:MULTISPECIES: ATP-binding protein [unclassified Coleofasciculus]
MQSTAQGKSSFLQELGSDLVFTQDGSAQYHSFYWRDSQQYGLTEEQVVGLPLSDTFYPIALEAYRDQIQRILENRTPERCIHSFSYHNQVFPFELIISPILETEGKAEKVLVIGHLLPEGSVQKVIDSLVPISLDPNQKLLTQIARKIRRTLDLDIIWRQTVDSLGKALQVNRCIICSYQPEQPTVKVEGEYCQDSFSSMLGRQLELEAEPCLKQALFSPDPVVADRITPGDFQQQSVLVVSTSYQDEPNGLISLHQCDRHRQWSDAEIELVRELAEQVGTAIAHGTLYKELELARELAEELSRLKSEFLANTSHELRTPLNGMIGFLKLILEGMADDPEEQREFIQEAHNSALHLLNIINDILDIAKIEAGKMELEFSPVELEELFSKVQDFTKQQAQQKNLSFSLEKPATHDGIILYGNYQRLLQVMLNLVGNAIKFTDEGGITISAEVHKKKVPFQGQEFPGYVKVRVADTGIGVSLDMQDRLFQSFSQVQGGLNRPYGGTGLGLAISQKLVETMGGVVHFFSMGENLGSTVTFTIPLYQEPVIMSKAD